MRVAYSFAATLVVASCATERPEPLYAPGAPPPDQPTPATVEQPDTGPASEPGVVGPASRPLQVFRGEATYYSNKLSGRSTASGELYDPKKLTAAHKKLPFGSQVRVINERTGASVVVRVNDRGPFGPASRVIDVSYAAAERLGMIRAGVIPVRLEVLSKPAR
jgi:rare lipoprotein A